MKPFLCIVRTNLLVPIKKAFFLHFSKNDKFFHLTYILPAQDEEIRRFVQK